MIEQHQSAAAASGAKIVFTCGFDSIPSDIGVYFMQQQMQQQHGVAANEIKYRTRAFKGGASGGTIMMSSRIFCSFFRASFSFARFSIISGRD